MSGNSIKQRANAKFRKPPGMAIGKSAVSEYEVAAEALAVKIARLKELRLARDAAVLAEPPKAVPTKKSAGKKKHSARSSAGSSVGSSAASLSDWLNNHHAGGRDN